MFQEVEGSPAGARVKFTSDERHAALDTAMPYPDWTHIGPACECPILSRRAKVRLLPVAQLPAELAANRGTIQISQGREGVSPHRVLTWGVYYATEAPTLPPVVFADTHYVSGAYSNPGQPGDADGWRRSTWMLGFAATRVMLGTFRAAGLTVILGGDFNRGADMPKLWPDQVWASDGDSIDKLLILPGSVPVEVLFTDWAALRSDHHLRWTRLRLGGDHA